MFVCKIGKVTNSLEPPTVTIFFIACVYMHVLNNQWKFSYIYAREQRCGGRGKSRRGHNNNHAIILWRVQLVHEDVQLGCH